MCAMFASEPVSRLSTQMTLFPRASSSSHRCEPRKPAPPVTRQVATLAGYPRPPASPGCASGLARSISSGLMARAGTAPQDSSRLTVAPIVGPDDPRRFTDSGMEITELYTDAAVTAQLALGEPRALPRARGTQPRIDRRQSLPLP